MPTLRRVKEVDAFYYAGYFRTGLDLLMLSGSEKWIENLSYLSFSVSKLVG